MNFVNYVKNNAYYRVEAVVPVETKTKRLVFFDANLFVINRFNSHKIVLVFHHSAAIVVVLIVVVAHHTSVVDFV